MDHPLSRPIYITGATGYIGGRLVPRLLDAGYTVRCLTRSVPKLEARPWAGHERLQVVEGDAPSCSGSRWGCTAAAWPTT